MGRQESSKEMIVKREIVTCRSAESTRRNLMVPQVLLSRDLHA